MFVLLIIRLLSQASESLLLASEKARSGPSQKLLEFSRRLQEEKQQQTQALELREFLMSGEADLEVNINNVSFPTRVLTTTILHHGVCLLAD